jgi:xanthine dehydrogenase/oxidase
MAWADNAYYFPNYASTSQVVCTNLPPNTSMRAPGVVQSQFATESMIGAVADSLGLAAEEVQQRNFYTQGQTTPYGQQLKYFSLPAVWKGLKESGNGTMDVAGMRADAAAFNKGNRWRKRGVSMTPVKYGIGLSGYSMGCTARAFADGTVQITHGGCEIGQGIHVKVAQAAAYAIGCKLDLISVEATNTDQVANSTGTGGSGTSESCCNAALVCCGNLMKQMAPYMAAAGNDWVKACGAAYASSAGKGALSAEGWSAPSEQPGNTFTYFVYAAAVSEVEVDILTGEHTVLSSSINYDCGKSLNPAVDIGQIEGAFIMALGYFTSEQVVNDSKGLLLSSGTWEYKPPSAFDIPLKFNVSFLRDAPNPVGVLGSKAVAEPPYALGNSVFFAMKEAIRAARVDGGKAPLFELAHPATPGAVQQACETDEAMFVLK